MFKPQRSIPTLVLAIVGLSLMAPACATQGPHYNSQPGYRDVERRAYDTGYRQGLDNGARDARDHRDFRVDRGLEYRDDGRGDRDEYRRFFRDGYRAGYQEGFERVARSERRYSSPAAQVGYRDGLEAGRDDARDRDGYDPRRSKRYREGDNDYNSRYGSRDQYKQEYRAAFQQGYDEGYRGARR